MLNESGGIFPEPLLAVTSNPGSGREECLEELISYLGEEHPSGCCSRRTRRAGAIEARQAAFGVKETQTRRRGGNRGTNGFDRHQRGRRRTTDRCGMPDLRCLWIPAILLAHKLKLFPLIANRPRSLPQVCEALRSSARRRSDLAAAVALGFLELRGGGQLTSCSTRGGLPSQKPDILRNISRSHHQQLFRSVRWNNLRRRCRTDTAPGLCGRSGNVQVTRAADLSVSFTRTMHSTSSRDPRIAGMARGC